MTLSPWLIYFAGIANGVKTLLCITTFFMFVISFIIWLMYFLSLDEDIGSEKTCKSLKPFRLAIPLIALLIGFVEVFVPSSKTIYEIMIIPPVVNSTVVQKLPDELQQFIDKELKIGESKKDEK